MKPEKPNPLPLASLTPKRGIPRFRFSKSLLYLLIVGSTYRIILAIRTFENPSECPSIYCVSDVPLAGLNNYLMIWFGLILLAPSDACICVPWVCPDYPTRELKRLQRQELRRRPLSDFVQVDRITAGRKFVEITERHSNNIHWVTPEAAWDRHEAYITALRTVVLKRGVLPQRHALEHAFYTSLFAHPTARIRKAIDAVLHVVPNRTHMVIHARIEDDMQRHMRHKNLTIVHTMGEILEIVEHHRNKILRSSSSSPDEELFVEASQYIFVAAGQTVTESDHQLLRQPSVTNWGGTLERIVKPDSLEYYLEASFVDFAVAVKADVFVGYSGSTQSNNIAFLRNASGTTFDYAPGMLVPRLFQGLRMRPNKVFFNTTTG